MKDPGYAIRKAYYARLNGSLSLNGDNVPVYDVVPRDAPAPYVVMSEQTSVDDSSKGCFGTESTILLDVVTRFKNVGTKRHVDEISNQILQLVMAGYNYPVADEDFKIYGVILENINTLETMEPSNYTIRKLIRLRNMVQQIEVLDGFPYTLPFVLA